jgi:hypothetical protein
MATPTYRARRTPKPTRTPRSCSDNEPSRRGNRGSDCGHQDDRYPWFWWAMWESVVPHLR